MRRLVIPILMLLLIPACRRRPPRVFPCEPCRGGVKVDGRLDEWEGRVWMPLTTLPQAGLNSKWRGPADGSAFVSLVWDADHLYVAARVRDANVASPLRSDRGGGDRLELTLRPGRARFELVLDPRFAAQDDLLAVRAVPGQRARLVHVNGGRDLGIRFDADGLPFTEQIDLFSPWWAINHVVEGWDRRIEEPEGGPRRWAVSRSAAVRFFSFGRGDRTLRVRAAPFPYSGGPGQGIRVFLNDQPVGRFPAARDQPRWTKEAEFGLRLPGRLFEQGENELRFEFDFAVRPSDVKAESEDGGRRAAAFYSIRMVPVAGAAGSALPQAVTWGDFDGDGDADLVVAAVNPVRLPDAISPKRFALAGFDLQGGWTWLGGRSGERWGALAAADVDHDGRDEILALTGSGNELHLLDPEESAFRMRPFRTEGWRSLAAGDMDGDGAVEIAAGRGQGLSIYVLERCAPAGFRMTPLVRAKLNGEITGLSMADLDGDGRKDIIVVRRSNSASGLWMEGWKLAEGGFVRLGSPRSLPPGVSQIATGDLEGNGRGEVIALSPGGLRAGAGVAASKISVLGWERRRPRVVPGVPGGVRRIWCANFLGRSPRRPVLPGEPGAAGPVLRGDAGTERSRDGIDGSVVVARGVPGGYEMEARIPWTGIGGAPSADEEMGLEVRLHDVDRLGSKEKVIRWARSSDIAGRARFLAAELPFKLGRSERRYLTALTAAGLPFNYLLSEDRGEIQVDFGAAAERVPKIRRLTLTDGQGLSADAALSRQGTLNGLLTQRWDFAAYGLADGPIDMRLRFADGRGRTLVADGYRLKCRGQEYGRWLKATEEGLAEIRSRIDKTAAADDRRHVLAALWLRLERDRALLAKIARARVREDLAKIGNGVNETLAKYESARGVSNPLADARGGLLLGYHSDVDDSFQPFALHVPESYTGDAPFPLIVHMHGAGMGRFRGCPAPEIRDCLVLSPCGRVWTDYMYVGEDDVLRVLALVRRRYNVDANRIYLAGGSMGGTGSLHLATRFPGLFAAAAPVCGNCDYRVWDEYWQVAPKGPPPRPGLRDYLKSTLSAITFAENLRNVPVMNIHGARDRMVYVEHSRNIVGAMRDAGQTPIYREDPEAGHGVPGRTRADRWAWLLAQRRAAHPRRVRYRTASRHHRGAHWVGVGRFHTPLRTASVDALIVRPNVVRVTAENVAAYNLDFRSWRRRIETRPVNELTNPSFEEEMFRPDASGGWDLAEGKAERVPQARDGKLALRLRGEGGEPAQLLQTVGPGDAFQRDHVAAGIWVRRAGSDEPTSPKCLGLRRLNAPPLPGALSVVSFCEADGERKTLAEKRFLADSEWQYVIVVAKPSENADLIVFSLSLAKTPTPAAGLVCDDAILVRGRTLPALAFDRTDPLASLTSDSEGPEHTWPWRPLNRLANGSFERWSADEGSGAAAPSQWRVAALRQAALSRSDKAYVGRASLRVSGERGGGLVRLAAGPVRLRHKPWPEYVAGVACRLAGSSAAARDEGVPKIRLSFDQPANKALNWRDAEMTISTDWKVLQLPVPRLASPLDKAELLLDVKPAGRTVLLDAAFIIHGFAAPDHLLYPDRPEMIRFDRPLRVISDGKIVHDGPFPSSRVLKITLHKGDAQRAASGPVKRAGMAGPLEDAFRSPFLLVYGTGGSGREQMICERAAREFVAEWRWRYYAPCRMKADSEVTEEDIARFNLILYGGPWVNALTARVNDRLPIRFDGNRVVMGDREFFGPDVGVKLVCPNPLNPERYVAVMAGTTWVGTFQINKRFGNWFGWRIYENRNWFDFAVFDNLTRGPGSFLAVGFLDDQWRIDTASTFFGLRHARDACLPRRVPVFERVPARAPRLYVSELLPENIGQRVGAVRFDRSLHGGPIRLGNERFERGLGVRAPCKLTYDIGGRFSRFTARVGVDLEGENQVPRDRAKAERIQFLVYGDGKLLAESAILRWNSPPEDMDADVTGVRELRLDAVPRGGATWLYGSAAWGAPLLEAKKALRGIGPSCLGARARQATARITSGERRHGAGER